MWLTRKRLYIFYVCNLVSFRISIRLWNYHHHQYHYLPMFSKLPLERKYVYLHSELVFSLKEGNPASDDNMLDSRGQHAKRNKLDTKQTNKKWSYLYVESKIKFYWNIAIPHLTMISGCFCAVRAGFTGYGTNCTGHSTWNIYFQFFEWKKFANICFTVFNLQGLSYRFSL